MACISGVKKGATHIRRHYDIFWKKLQKKIGYLNSSQENIQFKKKNHPKRSSGSEVMIILKSTKFQHFSGNSCMVFKIPSKHYLDLLHYKKRKWICVDIFPHFFHCLILIYIVQWVLNMALVVGTHSSCTHSPGIIFLSLIVQCWERFLR